MEAPPQFSRRTRGQGERDLWDPRTGESRSSPSQGRNGNGPTATYNYLTLFFWLLPFFAASLQNYNQQSKDHELTMDSYAEQRPKSITCANIWLLGSAPINIGFHKSFMDIKYNDMTTYINKKRDDKNFIGVKKVS